MNRFSVVVVAAGRGARMGTAESKQFLRIAGKPILVHTLQIFDRMEDAEEIVLVIGPGEEERCREYIREYELGKVTAIVTGGSDRQDSVYRGLQAVGEKAEWVLIHDGVRPLVEPDDVLACWRKAMEAGAAVLAVPVKDTIKMIDHAGRVETTPDRSSLWAVQTPQAFRLKDILEAHELACRDGVAGTDDAMLLERTGQSVHVVKGNYSNIKITTPEDLQWAEWKLRREG